MNSKSEGHEVSCPSPKLCFTSASRPWPATFPPTITWCFDLRQRHSFVLTPDHYDLSAVVPKWLMSYTPLWKIPGDSQIRSLKKSMWEPLAICAKGKNIIPSRQALPGAVDSGHFSELQHCGEMGTCHAQTWTWLAKFGGQGIFSYAASMCCGCCLCHPRSTFAHILAWCLSSTVGVW